MKHLFLILFLVSSICLWSQNTNDTIYPVFYLPGNVHVTVGLLDKSTITGDVWKFSENGLMMYGKNSAGQMVFKNISCTEMRYVKIKRHAFAKGAVAGTAVGSLVSDQIIENSSADSYASSAKTIAQSSAAIAAGALAGGAINSAATRKKFKINGSKQKFERVFEILTRAQPHNYK